MIRVTLEASTGSCYCFRPSRLIETHHVVLKCTEFLLTFEYRYLIEFSQKKLDISTSPVVTAIAG